MKRILKIIRSKHLEKETPQFLIFILLLATAYVVNTHIMRLATVNGDSMYPTLIDGDILLVNQINYQPSRDDIILIDISESSVLGQYIVKRVIAVEGDTVRLDYDNNSVFVNGIRLSEPYLNFEQGDPMIALDATNDVSYQVPTGTVFVMGDNRNNSVDSRSETLGMIRQSDIVGKVCRHLSLQQYFS